MDDLSTATATHSRLSIALDKCLKEEQTAELAFLQKEADVRKEYFPKMEEKKISVSLFEHILKDKTFDERIKYKAAITSRKISENQLRAQTEVLYSLKKRMSL